MLRFGVWQNTLLEEPKQVANTLTVVSVPIDPGNLRTELPRDQGIMINIMVALLCYAVVNGAYTELYAAFSPDVTVNSDWSQEWGAYLPP